MLKFNSLQNKVASFNFAFGALVIIGGMIGFFKAHSIPSLAAGMTFGNLLMLTIQGTPMLQKEGEKSKIWGYYVATLLSVILLVFFIIRLIKTGHPMPAAVIIILAVLSIFLNTLVMHNWTLASKDESQ